MGTGRRWNRVAEVGPVGWPAGLGVWVTVAVVVLLAWGGRAGAVEVSGSEIVNRRCLNCHGQEHVKLLDPGERRQMVSAATQPSTRPVPETRPELYTPGGPLAASVHKTLGCVDCHTQAKTLPHAARMTQVNCTGSCHSGPGTDLLQSMHAEAAAKGDRRAPGCVTCHGTHDIRKSNDRLAKTSPMNVLRLCGDCHKDHNGQTTGGLNGATIVPTFLDSVHGKAARGGLAVAATCVDCHTPHKVLPSKDARSTVNRVNVAATCGKCHTGLEENYVNGVHGEELAKGNKNAPVCNDCHTAHGITRTDTPAFKRDIVAECGSCHDKPMKGSNSKSTLYDTYMRSYHGQVTELGSTRAARCSDCHGAHDIKRAGDKNSRLQGAALVDTCATCHPGATASFARFDPHADHHDSARYPLLHGIWLYFVVMMSFAFGFFGLHSVFWFLRSAWDRVRLGPPPSHHKGGRRIMRFNRLDRVNHFLGIISFFGLTVTGLPLLYATKGWAKGIAAMFGGVHAAGVWHRIFAVMLILNFVLHGYGILQRVRQHGIKKLYFGSSTMMPTPKDVKDCLGMFRWFARGGRKPAFGRWAYWEKFDYMAEVGGSGIIGLSGLLLWFPVFFSQFVPGWVFNVATIVHGYEALLAIGFIFTIHFFNAHLRLEKFPVDDVIFTGSLPEEELKHERGAEYDELVKSGQIEALRKEPPPKWYRTFAVVVGILAMAVGTTLVVLIVLAGLGVI